MSSSSCKLAALPLVAAGHVGVACPGFPHIMQRLFSWQRLCSSSFSLLSGPRIHSLTWVVGGLVLLGPCGFTFIGSLLSLWHASFPSSCLSQYRLSYCWVTSTSLHSKSGLPSINSWSLSHSGRPS